LANLFISLTKIHISKNVLFANIGFVGENAIKLHFLLHH